MRQLALTGLLMLAGAFGGAFVVAGSQLLGAAMGAVLGALAAVIVLAFPRTDDYPPHSDSWLGD